MDSSAWVALLRLIPQEHHNNLAIVTSVNSEIVVQDIFRFEKDYLVIRGRYGGSTDGGRLFMLPYAEINHFTFHKPIPEPVIRSWFGDTTEVATAAAEAKAPAEVPEPAKPEAPPPPPAPQPTVSSRDSLLERMRARVQAGGANPGRPSLSPSSPATRG